MNPKHQSDAYGTRILVVDDDRLIREMTRDALTEEGFLVDTASSGGDALESIEKHGPYAVVITDLSMPEMDGLELMEKVKRAQPRTDVIILTGYASLESALQAMRLGAADYLRKPVEGPEIVYGVKRTILRRRLLSENLALRSSLQAFESSRVLTSCLEAGDIVPLTLDILGLLLQRGQAVGRLVEGECSEDSICLRGFSDELGRRVRDQIAEGKLFEPSSVGATSTNAGPENHEVLQRLEVDDELLVLPIRVENRPMGAIWIFAEGRPFQEEEIQRAELVVAQSALALVNAEKLLQAREKAFIDDVTDLYNARYLQSALDREVSRAQRYGLEVSVVFLDLDHFKQVNDHHGHLVGSRVLREFGHVLQKCVRSIDTVGRYGGDEFTILLVDTGMAEAMRVAERVRGMVAEKSFQQEQGLNLRITVSLGVAAYPAHGSTWSSLVDRSDKAMYLAKFLGRDRVCSADELSEEPGIPPVVPRGTL
jgi:diguanylate cyclase (GGDEF)-like protein